MPDRSSLHRDVEERLVAAGQRYTAARRRLVEALARVAAPLTLPSVLAADPELSQSSTYRNLVILAEAGAVRRLHHGLDQHAHYELAEGLLEHHHHLICRECGTVADVTLDDETERRLEVSLAAAARSAGFVPQHHDVDIYGACATCAAASPT